MPVRSFVPTEYFPTTPRSGNEGERVFRMQNMILRGTSVEPYAEVYGGSLDLNENYTPIDITGTVDCTINVTEIVGTGTLFTTELHLGQRLVAYGGSPDTRIPLVVDFITDDTHFTACRAPDISTSTANCTRLFRMFEMNKKRGVQMVGNAIQYELGTIVSVGDGVLYVDGQPLQGTSLTATRAPQVAIFDSTTGNYTVFPLGLPIPVSFSAAAVGGGTKNMQAGNYSGRVCQARQATNGYGNPSPKAEVTIVAGDAIRGTFPAADTGVDAWMIFMSLFSFHQNTEGSTQSIDGPWYRYQPDIGVVYVKVGLGAGEINPAGGNYTIEYNDAEIAENDLLSFNNDFPPDAEFVASVSNISVFISTDGPGNTSPGPWIAPVKPSNPEAAPSGIRASCAPPDIIVGFKVAPQRLASGSSEGALYLMCSNTLQIATPTGATDPRLPPLAVSQFWASGFKNPDCLAFVDGYLVGMTNHGLARSLTFGDQGSEEFGFATAMVELLKNVSPGHCLLALDPLNNAACLFSSAHSRNASGFWTTRVWMYGMRQGKWIGDILLTSDSQDMIVSGVATVNGQLEFLCGDHLATKTYRWDTSGVSELIPYYIAWQFSDWGVEDRPKHVGPFFSVVGTQQGGLGVAGIWGVEPGDPVPVEDLEAGINSKSGNIFLLAGVQEVSQQNVIELNIDNLKQFTVRIAGNWPGGIGIFRDRVDEVLVEAVAMGARR